MSLWLLLVDRNNQGLAVPVSTAPRHFTQSQGGKRLLFDADIKPDKGEALYLSAQKAVALCGALLWREGQVEKSGTVRFQLGGLSEADQRANETSVHGESGDLLFALAFLTAAVRRTDYPPFAATGVLEQDDKVITVKPVIGVPAKITAALQVLPAGSLLFYPKANQDDIPSDLHGQADAQGVTLIAVERLEEALVRLGITIEKVYLDTPYLGLQSFSYAERSIFFGREAAIEDLETLLLQREQAGKPGALIVAASGAGKSSLAQAGLLPALEKAGWAQTDSDNPPKPLRLALAARPVYWTQTWKPQHATERSAAGLLRSIIDNWTKQPLLQALPPVDNLAQLVDAFAATAAKERRFLWLIDQLEELFTLSFPYDAIDAFADFLQRLQQQGVWLVAMLRNDFYSRYQEHEATEPGQARLIDVFGGAHYDLLKPDEAALRRIIEWPAEKAGLSFETATDGSTLAEQIAQDLREGGVDALPLLQFALRQLWDGRESGQNLLTFKAYQAMGHLHGAIGQKAETVYQSLPPAVQTALPKLLWDLAIVREKHGDTGQRQYDYVAQTAQLSDYPEGSDGRALIEALADETVRLLVRDGGTVRVAHEALFRHWDTAQQQLAQLHEDMAVRERVLHEYEIWCAKGKTDDLLLMPVMRLAEGEALLQQREAFLDADLVAYIRASIEAEAERQRLEQERIQREQATAEEARQQAELAQARAEQVARQQTELAEQQTQLAQERQEKAEKLRRKARQLLAAALVSLGMAGVAGWYWWEGKVQKAKVTKTLAQSDFIQGTQLTQQEKPDEAMAYLARAIRSDSDDNSSDLAASILRSNSSRFSSFSMWHQKEIKSAVFSQDGRWVLTVSLREVRVWDAVTGKPVSEPMKHTKTINSASFSPEGLKVVTTSDDKTAQIWDAQTGKPLSKPMEHNNFVFAALFSPDGKIMASISGFHFLGYKDTAVSIWDVETGKIISKIQDIDAIGEVDNATFSTDGKYIITISSSIFPPSIAKVWDVTSGKEVYGLTQKKGFINALLWESDDKKYLIGKNSTQILDKNGAITPTITPDMMARLVAHSPDGEHVLTFALDNKIYVWSLKSGALHFSFPTQYEEISQVLFSPDGRWIAITSENIAQVLDAKTGKAVSKPMKHHGKIYSSAFSPDGRWIVTASHDKTACIWNAKTGEPASLPMKHDTEVDSAVFTNDGRKVLTISAQKGEDSVISFNIWEAQKTIQDKLVLQHQSEVNSASFSIDGQYVTTTSPNAGYYNSSDGTTTLSKTSTGLGLHNSPWSKKAQVWNTQTGDKIFQLESISVTTSADGERALAISKALTPSGYEAEIWNLHTQKPFSSSIPLQYSSLASFSLDGNTVIVAKDKNAVSDNIIPAIVLDVKTGKPVSPQFHHKYTNGYKFEISSVALSPDGRRSLIIDHGHTRMFDTKTGTMLFEIDFDYAKNLMASFSPDGQRILIVYGGVRILDSKTGKLLHLIKDQWHIDSASFSSDGQWLMTASSNHETNESSVRVWNASNGEPVSDPMYHQTEYVHAALSHDGKRVFTSSNRSAQVWDAQTAKQISPILKLEKPIKSVVFSPDGTNVVGASFEKSAHVFEITHLSSPGDNFADFLELASGYRLTAKGSSQFEPAKSKNELKAWLATAQDLSPEARHLIEWLLSDPQDRTVTPNSKQTVKERVQQLIDIDTIASLNEALDYWPGHPMALAKLAAVTLRDGKPEEREADIPRTRLWANLALKYAPDDAAVRAVAEPVLRDTETKH